MAQPKKEERGQRPAPKKGGMGLFVPALIAVILLGGAAIAILGGGKQKAAEQPTPVASKPKPFADLPPEDAPARNSSGSATRMIAQAPEGLSADANWQKAVKLATEAEALFDEATAAKSAQDTPKLNEKGGLARDKFDEAVTMTAVWEEELMEKYGDANPEVRRIMKTRSGWIDKLRWLHKSIAR